MRLLARAVVTGVLACGAGAALADWTLTLPDGRRVAIVADGAADPFTQILERRNPDGSLDRQFGQAGRVLISLGPDSPGPRSVRADSAGRLLIVGSAMGPQGHAVPAALRFLADGRLDLGWGTQGRSLVASSGSDAFGADVLPLPDNSLLLLGQIEGDTVEQAALWRLGADGAPDAGFGQAGTMRATGIDASQGLALQLDDDGAALIALQSLRQGMLWLEVHRWQPGQNQPQRVAYQPMPSEWQGPVTLARRGGAWQWFDASQPMNSGGVPLVAVAASTTWNQGLTQAVVIGTSATALASEGGAAWNPFSPTAAADAAHASGGTVTLDLPWPALALGVLTTLAGLGWWRWRRR
jgi:uncharacterized delta-60 repeat protein